MGEGRVHGFVQVFASLGEFPFSTLQKMYTAEKARLIKYLPPEKAE